MLRGVLYSELYRQQKSRPHGLFQALDKSSGQKSYTFYQSASLLLRHAAADSGIYQYSMTNRLL